MILSILPDKNRKAYETINPLAYATAVKKAREKKGLINGGHVSWPKKKETTISQQEHLGAFRDTSN